jgi:hypothetical protein
MTAAYGIMAMSLNFSPFCSCSQKSKFLGDITTGDGIS